MLNILSFVIFALVGCQKDPYVPIIYPNLNCNFGLCDTSKLEIVWQQPLSSDTAEWGSMPPIGLNNEILFTRNTYFAGIDTFKFFDAKNGTLKRIWADYLPNRTSAMSNNNAFFSNGKVLFTTWKDVYCIDYPTGSTVWRSKLEKGEGHPFMNVVGDRAYHVHLDRYGGKTHNSYLVQANIITGKWDTVHTQPMINNFEPHTEMPSVWVSPQKDTILIFQIRYVDFKNIVGTGNRTDIVAYNITQKKEYFRFDNIDRLGLGSTQPPYVLGDKVFVPLIQDVICFNMPTKTIQWQKDFCANFTGGIPFIFVENKFFVKPVNRTLYQIDLETGNELWVDKDNGSGCSDMIYHNGLLYYTCDGVGKIYAIEVATGKKIWAERSPNQFANKFNGFKARSNANIGDSGVAINAELGYIYVSDFYFAMCLKLPKR